MSLAAAPILEETLLHFPPDHGMLSTPAELQASFNKASDPISLHQLSATESSPEQPEEESTESFSSKPVKKLKTGDHNYNMFENPTNYSSVKLTQIVIEDDESSQQKVLSPSTQAGNLGSVSQKSQKDLNENSSGFSSSPVSEIAVEKDAIEEEDCFDSDFFKNLPLDDLRMEDEVIVEMRKEREQVMTQGTKGFAMSSESHMQRQQQQNAAFAAYMTNQMIWMNSLQQINQRNQSINFPYGTVNPIALASQLQQFKMASYCTMRNPLQNPFTQGISSVLGKRGAVYDHVGGQQHGSNVFVIDDDEVRPCQEATKLKKKPFIIERNVKPMKKKQVFKIIRDKPRRDRTTGHRQKTLSLIDKKSQSISKGLNLEKIGTSEEKTNGQLLKEQARKIILEKTENKKIQEEKNGLQIEEEQAKKGKNNKRRGAKDMEEEDEDSYVIKLHLDSDDDDNEDIIDTPVGPEFQVKIRNSKKQAKARKPLKLVWDPSSVEEEKVTAFYQKVETKFKRSILGEEFALKTWKEHNYKLKEVLAKLETNKIAYKNFFEMKQKMLRSRALH